MESLSNINVGKKLTYDADCILDYLNVESFYKKNCIEPAVSRVRSRRILVCNSLNS